MKTKNFFLMAVMLLLSVSAFAQEDVYDYYLGLATEEQIQDQPYINSLAYNQSGVKPTELTLPAGYNVIIYPSSWGTPTITDDNGFGLAPYTANDLGITNPTGKIVIVEEMSANQTHINISWESSQPTYTYYLSRGEATEAQIQDQSYINSLVYNMSGEKPTQIDFKYQYNVFVIPQSWGIPTVADASGFTLTPYQAKDLGITDPSGKRVLVYDSGNSTVYLTWESSDQTSNLYYSYVGTDINSLLVDINTGNLKADIADQIKTIDGVKTYTQIPESLESGITIEANQNYVYVIAPTETLNRATIYLVNSANMRVGTETLGTFNIGSTEYTVKSTPSEVGTVITAWESSGTTGISNSHTLKEANGAYHSLKGQRVNNPSNGIYIQNGKKILVK